MSILSGLDVNRFVQPTISQYTPEQYIEMPYDYMMYGLQEKAAQQAAADKAMADVAAGLNIDMDFLEKIQDPKTQHVFTFDDKQRANKIVMDYRNQLNQLASEFANKDKTTQEYASRLARINQEFKNTTSPTGELGVLAARKKAADEYTKSLKGQNVSMGAYSRPYQNMFQAATGTNIFDESVDGTFPTSAVFGENEPSRDYALKSLDKMKAKGYGTSGYVGGSGDVMTQKTKTLSKEDIGLAFDDIAKDPVYLERVEDEVTGDFIISNPQGTKLSRENLAKLVKEKIASDRLHFQNTLYEYDRTQSLNPERNRGAGAKIKKDDYSVSDKGVALKNLGVDFNIPGEYLAFNQAQKITTQPTETYDLTDGNYKPFNQKIRDLEVVGIVDMELTPAQRKHIKEKNGITVGSTERLAVVGYFNETGKYDEMLVRYKDVEADLNARDFDVEKVMGKIPSGSSNPSAAKPKTTAKVSPKASVL